MKLRALSAVSIVAGLLFGMQRYQLTAGPRQRVERVDITMLFAEHPAAVARARVRPASVMRPQLWTFKCSSCGM